MTAPCTVRHGQMHDACIVRYVDLVPKTPDSNAALILWPSTNKRIADDRLFALFCWRVVSISVTVCANVAPWACAISFSPLQNSSSRLMLVFCPPTITEQLMIRDFMASSFEHTCNSHNIVP